MSTRAGAGAECKRYRLDSFIGTAPAIPGGVWRGPWPVGRRNPCGHGEGFAVAHINVELFYSRLKKTLECCEKEAYCFYQLGDFLSALTLEKIMFYSVTWNMGGLSMVDCAGQYEEFETLEQAQTYVADVALLEQNKYGMAPNSTIVIAKCTCETVWESK